MVPLQKGHGCVDEAAEPSTFHCTFEALLEDSSRERGGVDDAHHADGARSHPAEAPSSFLPGRKVFSMPVLISGMNSLHRLRGKAAPGDMDEESISSTCTPDEAEPGDIDEESISSTCPIAMDDFDKAVVDFLPEDASFVQGRPDLCICTLPCRHSFHALSVLCHMALSGMRCPVCRCVCVSCVCIWVDGGPCLRTTLLIYPHPSCDFKNTNVTKHLFSATFSSKSSVFHFPAKN